jgi:hypothetical protein
MQNNLTAGKLKIPSWIGLSMKSMKINAPQIIVIFAV